MSDADTRNDDLRTGKPYWLETPRISVRSHRRPQLDRYDVVIVGAGISGALVAEALTRKGRSVLILDRRSPVRGSTPASTAMIQHEIDVPLTKLQEKRGARTANAAWRRSAKAVNDLVELSRRLKIKCHMEMKSALYLSGCEMGAKDLQSEAAARNKIGLEAEWIDGVQLRKEYGIDREGAILSRCSASANPAQLAAGLLRVAVERGAHIVSPTEITDMAEMPSGVALATSDGHVIVAKHTVFCTGYEFLRQMRSKRHQVTSTWAIATEPIRSMPPWLKRTIVWEASDPYLYFRADPSGRVIAGGEDEEASDKNGSHQVLARKAKTIAAKVMKTTGLDVGRIAHRWAAPFSVTTDGLPIIDRVPGYERIFAVMGFGGNGITFSMIAAQIVSAEIVGKSDPDHGLFVFR